MAGIISYWYLMALSLAPKKKVTISVLGERLDSPADFSLWCQNGK
jgi:hypothetical protein